MKNKILKFFLRLSRKHIEQEFEVTDQIFGVSMTSKQIAQSYLAAVRLNDPELIEFWWGILKRTT
jgi:hypothetical protein